MMVYIQTIKVMFFIILSPNEKINEEETRKVAAVVYIQQMIISLSQIHY